MLITQIAAQPRLKILYVPPWMKNAHKSSKKMRKDRMNKILTTQLGSFGRSGVREKCSLHKSQLGRDSNKRPKSYLFRLEWKSPINQVKRWEKIEWIRFLHSFIKVALLYWHMCNTAVLQYCCHPPLSPLLHDDGHDLMKLTLQMIIIMQFQMIAYQW